MGRARAETVEPPEQQQAGRVPPLYLARPVGNSNWYVSECRVCVFTVFTGGPKIHPGGVGVFPLFFAMQSARGRARWVFFFRTRARGGTEVRPK